MKHCKENPKKGHSLLELLLVLALVALLIPGLAALLTAGWERQARAVEQNMREEAMWRLEQTLQRAWDQRVRVRGEEVPAVRVQWEGAADSGRFHVLEIDYIGKDGEERVFVLCREDGHWFWRAGDGEARWLPEELEFLHLERLTGGPWTSAGTEALKAGFRVVAEGNVAREAVAIQGIW